MNAPKCKRILIVDDEEQIISTLSRSLKKLGDGYDIVTAANGHEALIRLREAPADLVITDLKMPGMDGVALTQVAYAILPGAKIIWMTAYDIWESEARRLGVYRYLNKPLDVIELRKIVREALETAAGLAEAERLPARKHILIIDDDPQEALDLCRALEQPSAHRYYAKISLAPEEALDSLRAEHFDLLVAALHTADQDGLNLIRLARQISPQMRAMWITNGHSLEAEQQARQLAASCLSTPVDPAQFAAAVESILR